IPGAKLTTGLGISNLLSFFGTGQCSVTEAFLLSLQNTGGFFSENTEAMASKFYHRIHLEAGRVSGPPIEFECMTAWGVPSAELAAMPVKPTKKKAKQVAPPTADGVNAALLQKFAPYYALEVQQQWLNLLGPLAGKDPETYEGQRPGWRETMDFFSRLRVAPFQDSLTAMQTVTTLVFSRIVEMPTAQEMGEWIAKHPKLGAARGLQYLGFDVSSSDKIIAAFICFHNLLADLLTPEQKQIVRFDVAFTENLLCKTVRWKKTLKDDTGDELTDLVTKVLQNKPALPFELPITNEQLQTAFRFSQVSRLS
ncbi:hypothetical protein C8F01DRAFT_980199, partial [Mycena amicta]